jgi:hypothetical protein
MASYLGNSPDVILQVRKRNYRYVATGGQNTFSGNDSNGQSLYVNIADVEVFLNGVLLDQTDYTITSTQLQLTLNAALDDIVEVITNTTFATADQYSKQEVDSKVAIAVTDLVGTAGTALNTLGELSDALNDDANYAATITTALGTKANTSSLATVATSGSYTDLTNKPTIPTVTPTAVSDQSNTSTGAFDIPSGTTAQRPASPNNGMIRYNTEKYGGEIYNDGAWVKFASLLDGSTTAKAIPNSTSISQVYSDFGYSGQQTLYLTSNDGTVVQTNTYKDGNNSVWILIAGIGDQAAGGTAYTGWYNQSRWTGVNNAFGSLTTANREYKNKLFWDYYYNDILVMQGQTESASIYTDWYNNSGQVAYTSNNWLSTRGRTLTSFLSGNNGPNLTTNGASGRVQIPVTFLKGSASTSRSYFYSPNSQDELNANGVIGVDKITKDIVIQLLTR